MTIKSYLKHSFSCLPDVWFEIDVDDSNKLVTVASAAFDSDLFGWLVTEVLPRVRGVVAWRDDNAGWTTPPSPYALRVRIGKGDGVELDAQVVRLADATGGGVAVQLTDPRPWS